MKSSSQHSSSDTLTNYTLCVPRPSSALNSHTPVLVKTQVSTDIPPNHVLLKVERFGFSANNVTYQALGEHPHFRYFDFHPAPTSSDPKVSPLTHALIPVWGFATILHSTHPKIPLNARVYGYLAPTRYLVLPVSPNDVNRHAFYVPRPHLPTDRRPYNQLLFSPPSPPKTITEDLTTLYRPLFWTSYWCEDWLYSTSYRGADVVLISSASAKTAFCLAYVMKKRLTVERRGGVEGSREVRIVGLTSSKNLKFTKGLKIYDEVLEYDMFASSPSFQVQRHADVKTKTKWLYVDVAGNASLNTRINEHFSTPGRGRLVAQISLGLTNLSPSSEANAMDWTGNTFSHTPTTPSPTTNPESQSLSQPIVEQFFMPEWLQIRKYQLPPTSIIALQGQAWKELMQDCVGWVEIERTLGAEEVGKVYQGLVGGGKEGGGGAEKGMVWSMWDEELESEAEVGEKQKRERARL